MRRVSQRTDSHCGPATLEMLFSFYGVDIDQDKFVKAAGAEEKLEEYGVTIRDMLKAVDVLAPDFKIWYRDHGTKDELDYIINKKNCPVGIEWQGRFLQYSDDNEFPDDGHYAVAVGIDIPKNIIVLADPFEPFSHKDRRFYLDKFLKRWWDVNEIVNPATGKVTHETDDQMMFIITKKGETFPIELGMKTTGI